MKEFLIKIKTGAEKDLTIGSFSGLTWGESLNEEENDRKTFTFNVSSQNSDLLRYIRVGRIIRLESENPSFKKSFVISSIGPVEGETENEDFFEVVAEDFASFIFSRNNVGMTLDTMTDDDYLEWLDSEGLDGNAEDLANYILVRGRLKSTDESKKGSWKIGREIEIDSEGREIEKDSDLSEHRVNLQLSDSNTYNALIEVALLTDTIMEFDYEKKTISFYNRADNKRFDKGFQLSPYFNLADLNITLTGETLFPILHMEGGEADTGMVVSAIPYLSYSSWERLHDNLKKELDKTTNPEGRAAALEKMKLGTFFENEYNKKENIEDPKGVLVGVAITKEEAKHIDSIPYLDSFLLSLDYYKDFIEGDEEEARFQRFLEQIYLDLGVVNSNLQSKNIRNMLIEEQVLITERRINEAAEVVVASRENIYEDESKKLDSLFMETGGRESEVKEFSNWILGDTIIPGSKDGKQFRDIYKGKYVFQEVDYDEYEYFKTLEEEEEEGKKVYSNWDEKSPLTGEGNPNLLYRTETDEGIRYFFTNDVKQLRGLKINIDETNKNGKTKKHENVEFFVSSEVGAGIDSETLEGFNDEVDDSKWKNWNEDKHRQYIDKKHTVEIVDPENDFKNWEDFFNHKEGDEDRIKIKSEGKLRYPELKPEDPGLVSSIKPVLESDWESAYDSVDGYTKIKKEDGFYRNSSGTELYSGHTNPSMSYPVRAPKGFYPFHKDAQFYPLNDNITLVVEQGNSIGYVHKNSPDTFARIRRNATLSIPNGQMYRVFFYSDSRFAISWGDHDSSTIGLYTANNNGIDLSGSVVPVDAPIGTVTGGWYREKELLDENIIVKTQVDYGYTPSPFLGKEDQVIDNLGFNSGQANLFSIGLLKEELRDHLAPNRTTPHHAYQKVLDNTTIGSEYVIVGYTDDQGGSRRNHYMITMTFTLGSKQEGFYFLNTDRNSNEHRKIEASTWNDRTTELKPWQFANVELFGHGKEKDWEGYDQIITHKDVYLFITADPTDYDSGGYNYQWSGWTSKGSEHTPSRKFNNIFSQERLYLLQTYDSNTSLLGNIYFLKKDNDNKTNIIRFAGNFNDSTISSPGENMIWLGGENSLKISSQDKNWIGTYQTVTTISGSDKSFNDAESSIEFPKILQMEPEKENNKNKWNYLPFKNTIFYKGKLDTNWRVDKGHTIDLGERITQEQVEAQVSDGKIPLDAISYHKESSGAKTYNGRQMSWGVRGTSSTIPSFELKFDFKVTEAWIEHTKSGFDMLRFETPYLDLLNVFRGQDYIRDLNYKYRREIDFYINERRETERKIDEAEVEEKEFYNSELEAIESEIGDVNGYILPDKLKGLGDFWKYRTLTEYQNETGVESIKNWKNYSAWIKDPGSIKFENIPNITINQNDLIVVEFRATDPLKINGREINDRSGFWEKRIFVSEKPFVEVSGENIQIRSIKVVDPEDKEFIKTLNNLITWKNETIYVDDNPVEMTPPDAEEGEGVTIDHMRVFLTQSEKYTGASDQSIDRPDENTGESDESKGLGYSTIKGRLTLKQNRFEHFMWDRESRSTKASPITYEKSTHGELKEARTKREDLWFDLKQKYPEFLLEGYYTNETENDAHNLLQQAKASYKYHNKPSEEYSIAYIEAQDLVGDANDVRVGDKVAIKSRMRDQLGLSDRLQVTAISRELRDPGNVQIEVSPIRRDNLLEKVFGLVKTK